MPSVRSPDVVRLAAGLGAVAAVTVVYVRWLHISNAATVSTTFLLVVLVVAATSRFWVAASTSIVAMLCFNFFFLPPVGTLTIADPQNWVALFAFLAVSLVASNLSAVARTRTREAVGRQHELARLFDLSRDVLLVTDSREAVATLARAIAGRFDLEFVAVALPRLDEWQIFEAGTRMITLDRSALSRTFATAQGTRDDAGHGTVMIEGQSVRLISLRVGTRPIGLLATTGRPIEPGTLDTLTGVVAIAVERAQLLEDRKSAEATRQREALKTVLLASLGHDLRTPLTAIRLAATNIKTSALTRDGRMEQTDLILTETDRLTRLFENILEMARIDAGAVASAARWTHPSEIIAAARIQVEHALRGRALDVRVELDVPVRLDPRLTATALAHLLENAAQYTPPDSPIDVRAHVTKDGLLIEVRDHGPGIAPEDLPHLFERFYRGAAATTRVAGTGMGLSIARGLIAVERGRIWAENCVDGGARFIVVVPAAAKESETISVAT
jgi:two-component system sensor histidine kinase KdpD